MRRASVWGFGVMFAAAVLLGSAGCGGGGDQSTGKAPGEGAGPAQPNKDKTGDPGVKPPIVTPPPNVKPTAGAAAIVGRVRFNGEPPKRRPINFGAEKKCHIHETPPLDDSLVVSPNREIQWVLVRIAGSVPGNHPAPSKPAMMDQKGCVFLPHVLVVRSGQEVEIHNSDEVLHNVRGESVINPPFNRNLPKGAEPIKMKFANAEIGVKVKCDVHFWMGGYIHVVPHPYFAVTGEDGAFTIDKVPPGTYKVETWHEKLGKQVQDVTVKDGEVKTIDFTYQPK